MGLPASLSPQLEELQKLLFTISATLQQSDKVPSTSVLSLPPFNPPLIHYPVQPPHSSIPRLNPVPAHPPIAPIPRSSVNPPKKPFTEIIRDSILSQPIVRPKKHPQPQPRPSRPNRNNHNRILRQKASSKLSRLRALSEKGIPVCYRCGGSDHLTVTCRSSLVCFVCAKTGHRSNACPALYTQDPPLATQPSPSTSIAPNPQELVLTKAPPVIASTTPIFPPPPSETHIPSATMIPPPSTALLAESNILPVMRYYATPGTTALRQSLCQGVVLHDLRHVGPDYLLSCLRLLFPTPNWNWNIRELPDHHYLISPPSEEWKDEVIRAGDISFGGIIFPATLYDFRFFNGGTELKEYWIRVYGYPQDLWRDTELRQLARDLGGVFIAADLHSSLIAFRLKIGVPDKEVISACRRLIFTDPKGKTHSHIVQIQVEDSEIPHWGSTRHPVFDASFIRESSISPQPSDIHSDNFLSLAPPVEPNPLLVDLNSYPENDTNTSNNNFLDLLFSNNNGVPSHLNDFSSHIPDTPLPDIASPQIPPPLLPQPNTQPINQIQMIPIPDPIQPIPIPIPEPIQMIPIPEPIQPIPIQAPPLNDPEINPQAPLEGEPQEMVPMEAAVPPVDQVGQLQGPIPAPLEHPPAAIADQPPAPQVQAAPEMETEETRHSLRLKVNRTGGPTRTRGRQGSSSGTTIIQQFPYINLTDQEIISLFEVSGMCLGHNLEEKLKVVSHLRLLSRSRFSDTCMDLIPKIPPIPPIDISSVILSIEPESTIVSND